MTVYHLLDTELSFIAAWWIPRNLARYVQSNPSLTVLDQAQKRDPGCKKQGTKQGYAQWSNGWAKSNAQTIAYTLPLQQEHSSIRSIRKAKQETPWGLSYL